MDVAKGEIDDVDELAKRLRAGCEPRISGKREGNEVEHGNWKSMYEAACAGDLDLVRYYVQAGVDVNYEHPEFMSTALVSCILAKRAEVALFLLDNGADPALLSPWEEMTPMQATVQADLPAVKQRLLSLGEQSA